MCCHRLACLEHFVSFSLSTPIIYPVLRLLERLICIQIIYDRIGILGLVFLGKSKHAEYCLGILFCIEHYIIWISCAGVMFSMSLPPSDYHVVLV
jgi:hypothetical protein